MVSLSDLPHYINFPLEAHLESLCSPNLFPILHSQEPTWSLPKSLSNHLCMSPGKDRSVIKLLIKRSSIFSTEELSVMSLDLVSTLLTVICLLSLHPTNPLGNPSHLTVLNTFFGYFYPINEKLNFHLLHISLIKNNLGLGNFLKIINESPL